MKTILSATALATVAMLAAGAANAQTTTTTTTTQSTSYADWMPWNWVRGDETYVSVKGAYGIMQEFGNTGPSSSINFENGWGGSAAVGKYLNPNIRAEIEAAYYYNQVDNVDVGSQSFGAGGQNQVVTGMLNAYYEPFANCRLKPYIGAGVGVLYDDLKVENSGVSGGDSDTTFGYQAMAGVSYQLNTSTALTAEYRYVGATGLDLGTINGDLDYNNHLAMVGVRFKF